MIHPAIPAPAPRGDEFDAAARECLAQFDNPLLVADVLRARFGRLARERDDERETARQWRESAKRTEAERNFLRQRTLELEDGDRLSRVIESGLRSDVWRLEARANSIEADRDSWKARAEKAEALTSPGYRQAITAELAQARADERRKVAEEIAKLFTEDGNFQGAELAMSRARTSQPPAGDQVRTHTGAVGLWCESHNPGDSFTFRSSEVNCPGCLARIIAFDGWNSFRTRLADKLITAKVTFPQWVAMSQAEREDAERQLSMPPAGEPKRPETPEAALDEVDRGRTSGHPETPERGSTASPALSRAELVERLRGQYAIGPPGVRPPEFGYRQFPTVPIQLEAADAIEAQAARVAELEREVERLKDERDQKRARSLALAKGREEDLDRAWAEGRDAAAKLLRDRSGKRGLSLKAQYALREAADDVSALRRPEPEQREAPSGPWKLERDEHGLAFAISRGGRWELHLERGTTRNEAEGGAQLIVDALNAGSAQGDVAAKTAATDCAGSVPAHEAEVRK